MKLLEYFDGHFLGSRDVALGTEIHYRGTLLAFQRWLGRTAYLDDLTSTNVNAWLSDLQKTAGSKATVRSKRGDMMAVWRYAWEAEFTDNHPRGIRRIKLPDKLPCAWSPSELQRLMAATELPQFDVHLPNGVNEGRLLLGFVRLLYDVGARLGDTLELKWSAIDQQTGRLAIVQQKTGERHCCRVRPATLEILNSIPHPLDKAIPFPYGRAALWDRWRKLLAAAGLPSGRREMTQKLRRTSATELAREHGPDAASRHLGHSRHSIGLAQRNYLGPRAYPEPPLPPEVA